MLLALGLELSKDSKVVLGPSEAEAGGTDSRVGAEAGGTIAGCHNDSSLAAAFLEVSGECAFCCLGALPAARIRVDGVNQDAVIGVLSESSVLLTWRPWLAVLLDFVCVLDFCVPSKTAGLGRAWVEFSCVTPVTRALSLSQELPSNGALQEQTPSMHVPCPLQLF